MGKNILLFHGFLQVAKGKRNTELATMKHIKLQVSSTYKYSVIYKYGSSTYILE